MFVEVKDVFKLYTDPVSKIQIPALRGVELDINEGDLTAIIGPSGAGKSTLINLIGGIDKPSSGSIVVNEKAVEKLTRKELTEYRRNNVGFLYQSPRRNLVWNISAFANVRLPMQLANKFTLQEQKRRAKELLANVGLDQRSKHKPHQLSGGEAQRVGIAVALANDPSVVLADEPTGELDSATTFKIIDYFTEISKTLGKTFIVVTHDHRFANMTEKTVRILDGLIVGAHRAIDPKISISDREEVFYIDNHGNLRLPDDLRNLAGVQKYVKLKMVNGHITIFPARGDLPNE